MNFTPAETVAACIIAALLGAIATWVYELMTAKDLEDLDKMRQDTEPAPLAVWKTRPDTRVTTKGATMGVNLKPLDVPDYQLTVAIAQAFYRTYGRNAISTLLARYNAESVNGLRPEDRTRLIQDMERDYKFDWQVVKLAYLERLSSRNLRSDAQTYGRRQRDAEDSKPADLDPPVWPWGPRGVAANEVQRKRMETWVAEEPGDRPPKGFTWNTEAEVWERPAPAPEAAPEPTQTNVASDPPASAHSPQMHAAMDAARQLWGAQSRRPEGGAAALRGLIAEYGVKRLFDIPENKLAHFTAEALKRAEAARAAR